MSSHRHQSSNSASPIIRTSSSFVSLSISSPIDNDDRAIRTSPFVRTSPIVPCNPVTIRSPSTNSTPEPDPSFCVCFLCLCCCCFCFFLSFFFGPLSKLRRAFSYGESEGVNESGSESESGSEGEGEDEGEDEGEGALFPTYSPLPTGPV